MAFTFLYKEPFKLSPLGTRARAVLSKKVAHDSIRSSLKKFLLLVHCELRVFTVTFAWRPTRNNLELNLIYSNGRARALDCMMNN